MMRAGIWIFAGTGGKQLAHFAVVMILARLLTPEAFGIVAVAQVILSLSQVVVQFGIGAALIQSGDLTRNMERSALSLMLAIAAFISGLIFFSSNFLSHILNAPQLPEIMPVMLLTFLLSAASNPPRSLLMRDMRFRELAAIDVGSYVFAYALVAVTLAFLGYSYWAIIFASLAQAFVQTIAIFVARPLLPRLRMTTNDISPLLRFGGGLLLAQIMANVAQRGDNMIVSAVFGIQALGYYSRAYALMDLANSLLGSVFHTTLYTGFSKQRRDGEDKSSRKKSFIISHSFCCFLILPISCIMCIFSENIIAFLLGPQWDAAAPVLTVLALGMYFRLGYKVSSAFVLASGDVKTIVIQYATYAAVSLAMAYAGSFYSIVGVAMGITIALGFQFVFLTRAGIRSCDSSWLDLTRAIAPFFIAAGSGSIATLWAISLLTPTEWPALLVTVGGSIPFTVVYLLVLLLFRNTGAVSEMWLVARRTLGSLRRGPRPEKTR